MSHDLMFVAPEQRDEVRRRIAAVEQFIAAPGRRAAEAAAARLGLSTAQFYNLVRAWRAKQRPEIMMGRHSPREMQSRIDPLVLDLIDEVISADRRAAASVQVERVRSLATTRGIELPDPSTVARYVRRKRPMLLTEEHRRDVDLIIDHTVVDLPVDFGDGQARRPLVTVVIDVASEAPVALSISRSVPSQAATAEAIFDALRGGIRHANGRAAKRRMSIVAMSEKEGANVVATLRQAGIDAGLIMTGAHGGGLVVESLLGPEPVGLRLKQRLVWHHGEKRLAAVSSGAPPLTIAEAETLIRGRLLHGRPTTAFSSLSNRDQAYLARSLAKIAQAD